MYQTALLTIFIGDYHNLVKHLLLLYCLVKGIRGVERKVKGIVLAC